MLARVAALLGFAPKKPEFLLFDHGATVPTDGTASYHTGAVFAHTDGAEGTAFYVNEGTATSCDFNVIASVTAAQEALLSAVAGTVTASKAVIVDANKDAASFRNLGVTGTLTAAILARITAAREATVDGTGTGTIADAGMIQFVTVTSDDANKIVVLPAPTPGTIVILHVAATGYELRTSDPATIGINGGTGAGAESAIGANTTAILVCATATSWKGLQLGSDGTLAKVEVAA